MTKRQRIQVEKKERKRANEQRAMKAERALRWYKKAQLGENGRIDESTMEDLLADLQHLCNLNKWNWLDGIDSADRHFSAEIRSND